MDRITPTPDKTPLGSTFEAPEWVRRFLFALDARKLAGDALQIPTLPHTIATLVGAPETASHLTNDTIEGWAKTGQQLRQEARTDQSLTDEPISVDPSTGKLDVDIGSLLLEEGPLALVPMGAGVRVASTASRAAKIGAGVANTAANLVLPGAQGPKYATAAATQLAATAGIPLAVEHIVNSGDSAKPTSDLSLDSMFEKAANPNKANDLENMFTKAAAAQAPTTVAVSADPLEQMFASAASPTTPVDDLDSMFSNATQPDRSILDRVTTTEGIALGAAALAAGAVGRRLAKLRSYQQAANAASTTTGAVPTGPTITGPIDRLTSAMFDRNNALYAAGETALKSSGNHTQDAVDLMKARWFARTTSANAGDMFIDAANTGVLPNSTIRVPRMTPIYQALGELTPNEYGWFRDLVQNRARLGEMQAQGTNVWKALRDTDLVAQNSTILQNAPHLGKLADDLFDVTKGMADYMYQRGYIDEATLTKFKKYEYAPLELGQESTSLLDDILGPPLARGSSPVEAASTPNLQRREALDKLGGVEVGEVKDPAMATLDYAQRTIRAVEMNAARYDMIRLLQSAPETAQIIKPASSAAGKDVLTLRNNGQMEHYHITDPAIRVALEQAPQQIVPIINAARLLVQQGATGRFNPFFVLRSLQYEGTAAVVNKAGVTNPLNLLASVDAFGAESLLSKANKIDVAQYLDPQLVASMGGPQNVAAMSRQLMQDYEQSASRLFQRFGAGASPALDPAANARVSSLVDRIAPQYAVNTDASWSAVGRVIKNSAVARAYNHLMETAYNSVRMSTFSGDLDHVRARAFANPGASLQDVTDIGDELALRAYRNRVATGDAQAIPGSLVGQVVAQSIPYWQRSLVGLKAYKDAFRQRPLQTSMKIAAVTSASLGLMYAQYQSNPEAFVNYMETTTPSQRLGALPILDDKGGWLGAVRLDPTQQLVTGPITELMNQILYRKLVPDPASPSALDYKGMSALANGFASALGYDLTEQQVRGLSEAFSKSLERNDPRSQPGAVQLWRAVVNGEKTLPDGTVIQRPEDKLFGTTNRSANSDVSAYTSNLLTTLVPALATPLLSAMEEHAHKNGEDTLEASFKRTMDKWGTTLKDMYPETGTLFSNSDRLTTKSNVTSSLVRDKLRGIDKIQKMLGAVNNADSQDRSGFVQYTALPNLTPELHLVFQAAKEFGTDLRAYTKARAEYNRQLQAVRDSPAFATSGDARKKENAIINEMNQLDRRYYGGLVALEDAVSSRLGKHFSFEHFNPNEFR